MLHVVFKVREVLRFIVFQNYSPSFSSQFIIEYWHWTVMELLAHFSMVIVSSKPTMLYAMLNSCMCSPPPVHHLTFIYRVFNLPLYCLVTQSCKLFLEFYTIRPCPDYPKYLWSGIFLTNSHPLSQVIYECWTAQTPEKVLAKIQQHCLSIAGTGCFLLTLYYLAFKVSVIYAFLLTCLLFLVALFFNSLCWETLTKAFCKSKVDSN